ncbi:alpha/beta-hydrolase [Mollisia scopiformis]|uniref:Alpha/beta-hydrolase n=1 Tax=Mollisia scopiformis TaxID=149040 RepID=A0A194X0X3_MOLSC|nr:alpha/beta-hydrolase [Mollisia scopiformis]KUJ13619.1 alpha/beta-hydrolase [Mollisia scopiformis]
MASASFSYTSRDITTSSTCQNFLIPINVTSIRFLLDIEINDDWDAVDYIFNATRRDTLTAFQPIVGNVTAASQYNIGATFCAPKTKGTKSETVLLLTHGSMQGREYWNPAFSGSDPYNFVKHALNAGYSVFLYDRIGNGQSSRPDPVTEVQYPVQVEMLTTLAKLVKTRQSLYTLGVKVNKIVHVAHSFGSFIALSSTASSPTGLVDGVVLTGFSGYFQWLSLFTSGGQARVAALSQPSNWGSLPHGYLTPVDIYALSYGGFKSPYFDHGIAQSLFDQQYPFAIGELLSAGATVLNLSAIEVPVQVVEGAYDLTACGGNCIGVVNETASFFPNSKNVEVNGSFNAGHFLNYHYDPPQAFDLITSFVDKSGL